MEIFNSLGSNYDLRYVLKALFHKGSAKNAKNLEELLSRKYGGEAALFYKGREALTLALSTLNLPAGSEVAINGFTCVAVFNAIRKAGIEPVCLDLDDKGGLNFTPEILKASLKKNRNIKAVVIQNTLGYPCEIEEIKGICDKNGLILIEDLAHCINTKYKNGKEAGTIGDFAVLSFSQDKIIDAVSGGALVIRNKKYIKNLKNTDFLRPKGNIKDRLYPYFTYKIRRLYRYGLGKVYHYTLKKIKALSDIMNESYYDYYSLPVWNAGMALFMFEEIHNQLEHRKRIAQTYAEGLPDSILMFPKKEMVKQIPLSSNLRFPIFVNNRDELVNEFKKNGIYLADIWYSDVSPECPNAVADSKIVLNLPTHVNVSLDDSWKIVNIINRWIQK
jgi:dTDP-4-amino-4,6-dideoxygalactose transaminase